MDPLTILGVGQGLLGLGQSIFGGGRARRAQRALENLQVPTTTSSAEISDYYNRATASPYDTAFYRNQQQNINRGTSTAIGALQDRRSALAGISSVIRAQNDAQLRAGASAEQQQRAMLGDAVRLKASDNERVFQQNKMLPFQKQFSLLSSKAAGGAAQANAGLQNIFGGFQTAAMGGGFGNLFGGRGAQTQSVGALPTNIPLGGLGYASPADTFSVTPRTFNY